jgi:hypothetical protein
LETLQHIIEEEEEWYKTAVFNEKLCMWDTNMFVPELYVQKNNNGAALTQQFQSTHHIC